MVHLQMKTVLMHSTPDFLLLKKKKKKKKKESWQNIHVTFFFFFFFQKVPWNVRGKDQN